MQQSHHHDFAEDPKGTIPAHDRINENEYPQRSGIWAGFEYFRNFERDAKDFQELAQRQIAMPVLVLAGKKSGGTFLVEQVKQVASNVRSEIVMCSDHWLMKEAPEKVIPAIMNFIN